MLLRLLILLAIGGFIYFKFKKYFAKPKPQTSLKSEAASHAFKDGDLVEDPHCHTYVTLEKAVVVSIDGKNNFFCSQECADKYKLSHTSI